MNTPFIISPIFILNRLSEKYSLPLTDNLYTVLKTILISRKYGWEPNPEDIPKLYLAFPFTQMIPEEMFNELLTMKLP